MKYNKMHSEFTNTLFSSTLLIAITILLATVVEPASAQQTDQGTSKERVGIEEIVVTARKREESLQDTPIAVSAFDARVLNDANIVNAGDIIVRTPNLSFTPFSAADPQLFIRGAGSSDDGAGGDPSVVVFFDEIAVNRAGGASFNIYDMQRVEVLRGPQGTLYGKNAAGGAINFITNKPEDTFSASLSVTPVGDRDRKEVKGYVNIPINDTVYARFAGNFKDRDGFSRNLITGNDVEDESFISGRAQLLFQPSQELDILFSLEYSEDDNVAGSRKPLPAGGFANRGFTPNPNPRFVETPIDGEFKRDVFRTHLRIDWEHDFGTLTSITAYRDTETNWTQDLGGLPVPPFILRTTNIWREDDEQFTQELRLAGSSFNDRLDWVVGLYYSDEDIDREEEFVRSFAGVGANAIFDQFNNSTSYAAFGQFIYSLTDKLNVTFGARYTKDEKDIDLAVVDGSNGVLPSLAPASEVYSVSPSENWTAFTPKGTLDFAITDDHLLYASISRGYKSGGFQAAPANAASAATSFDPEFALSYELGAKTQWFDDRFRLNVSGFFMDYEDLQVLQLIEQVPGDPSTLLLVTDNAANAEVWGVELEFLLNPFHGLEIGGSYSWLDAEFSKYITNTGADLAGNKLRRSPQNAYNVFTRYGLDLSGGSNLSFHVSYNRKGRQFFENDNRRVSFEESYGLLDANIKYLSADGKWDVTLWGKNLNDALYRAATISVADSGFSRIAPPRTWGLSFSMRFAD